jgi:hypothetical protein
MLVKLGRHRTLTLPKELRPALSEETLLDLTLRPDGVIELRIVGDADPAQAWFWEEEWQKGEQQASGDIAAGRVREFTDVDAFIAHLEAVPNEDSAPSDS